MSVTSRTASRRKQQLLAAQHRKGASRSTAKHTCTRAPHATCIRAQQTDPAARSRCKSQRATKCTADRKSGDGKCRLRNAAIRCRNSQRDTSPSSASTINQQPIDRPSQSSNQSSFFESSFFSSLKFSNACTSPRTPAVSMDTPMQAGTRYRRAGCAASKKCMTPTVTARPAV